MLCHHLMRVNWTPMFLIKSCEEVVDCFCSLITDLHDYDMPVVKTSHNNLNKSWVTKHSCIWLKCANELFSHQRHHHCIASCGTTLIAPHVRNIMRAQLRIYTLLTPTFAGKKTKQFLYSNQPSPFQSLQR